MLRAAWFIARKDVQYMLREKETLLWTFIMPIIFFFFIGTISGGFAGDDRPDRPDPLVLTLSPQAGFLADHLATRLEGAGYRFVSPDSVTAESNVTRLDIPAAFTDSVLAGHPVTLAVTRKSGGLGADYDQVRVQRAVFAVLGDLVGLAARDEEPTPAALTEAAAVPRHVELRVERAGHRLEIPTGFSQAVPGTMVMFTLFVLLTSGSVLIVIERKQGLLRRLASSPVSRGSVVLGKWGGRLALGLIQIAFAMIVGSVLFHVDWGPNLGALLLVLLAYAGLIAAIGMLLGNFARTEGQAVGIGVLAGNVISALGGCWWPIEVTPLWMQKLSLFLPTGIAMDALHKLVNFGAGPETVIPHIAVMAVAAAAAGWLAARVFRFQ